jgi:hypothetical protein
VSRKLCIAIMPHWGDGHDVTVQGGTLVFYDEQGVVATKVHSRKVK